MAKELTLKDILGSISSLKDAIDKRFDAVDDRFSAVDKRFDAMDQRFDKMDVRFDKMDVRFDMMDIRFNEMDERFDDMHEAMNLHSSETDEQFRQLRTSVATKDYVDERIGKLRGEFRQALKTTRGRTL